MRRAASTFECGGSAIQHRPNHSLGVKEIVRSNISQNRLERDRATVENFAAGAKALLPQIELLTASVSDAPYEWNRGRSVLPG